MAMTRTKIRTIQLVASFAAGGLAAILDALPEGEATWRALACALLGAITTFSAAAKVPRVREQELEEAIESIPPPPIPRPPTMPMFVLALAVGVAACGGTRLQRACADLTNAAAMAAPAADIICAHKPAEGQSACRANSAAVLSAGGDVAALMCLAAEIQDAQEDARESAP